MMLCMSGLGENIIIKHWKKRILHRKKRNLPWWGGKAGENRESAPYVLSRYSSLESYFVVCMRAFNILLLFSQLNVHVFMTYCGNYEVEVWSLESLLAIDHDTDVLPNIVSLQWLTQVQQTQNKYYAFYKKASKCLKNDHMLIFFQLWNRKYQFPWLCCLQILAEATLDFVLQIAL